MNAGIAQQKDLPWRIVTDQLGGDSDYSVFYHQNYLGCDYCDLGKYRDDNQCYSCPDRGETWGHGSGISSCAKRVTDVFDIAESDETGTYVMDRTAEEYFENVSGETIGVCYYRTD